MRTKFKPSMNEQLARVSVILPTSVLTGLDEAARYALCSRSQIIRNAVVTELRKRQADTGELVS